jgi:hypothetical protein
MKYLIKLMFCFILFGCIENLYAAGCTPDSYYYNIIQKKKWKLVQIQNSDLNIEFNRFKMTMTGKGKCFTNDLCEKYIDGIAIYSKFKTPYTIKGSYGNGEFKIYEIARNIISPEVEFEDITEDVYYEYLSKINRWRLYKDNLFKKWTFYLIIDDENKGETILTFNY